MDMAILGYARVSTQDQNLTGQLEARRQADEHLNSEEPAAVSEVHRDYQQRGDKRVVEAVKYARADDQHVRWDREQISDLNWAYAAFAH